MVSAVFIFGVYELVGVYAGHKARISCAAWLVVAPAHLAAAHACKQYLLVLSTRVLWVAAAPATYTALRR